MDQLMPLIPKYSIGMVVKSKEGCYYTITGVRLTWHDLRKVPIIGYQFDNNWWFVEDSIECEMIERKV